jgi:outer membrane receptor protein involved in Fe transport
MGVSSYFTTDLRLRWRPARQWTVALGIDNLNNYKLLELPSLSAAKLQRRAEVGPVTLALRSIRP